MVNGYEQQLLAALRTNKYYLCVAGLYRVAGVRKPIQSHRGRVSKIFRTYALNQLEKVELTSNKYTKIKKNILK